MRSFICLLALGVFGGVLARCEWYLEANDCICMNSTDGSLARTQTNTCCKATGYKTTDNVGFSPSTDFRAQTVFFGGQRLTNRIIWHRSVEWTKKTGRVSRTAARV